MPMKNFYIPAIPFVLLVACNNLDDAKLADRSTFMHFYEGAYSMTAAAAKITSDGYVIAGTVHVTGNKKASRIIIITTDFLGQKTGEVVIDDGMATGLKIVDNSIILIGNHVEYNSSSSEISELENYNSRLIVLDKNLTIQTDITAPTSLDENGRHIDYFGNAIAFDGDNNRIITLGSYQEPGKSAYSYVTALSFPLSGDTTWTQNYNYIIRDYVNAKSVHYKSGQILWGTSITEKLNAFNYSYLAIPVVLENAAFINSNYFGQNDDQQVLKIHDLCESPLGYAAVGTYSKPDGSNSDIFFIKVDKHGTFDGASIRYFDGIASAEENILTAPSLSDVTESGESLTPTQDGGFVIAGTLLTDEGKGIGNGGQDVWLVKVDGFGITQWSRILGSHSSERAATIREVPGGGLLICGTIQDGTIESGGLSSIFLMRTDANGELKK